MNQPSARLIAITYALRDRGFTSWDPMTWSAIHDAVHVFDLRLSDRTREGVGAALTALPTPELVRAECLALAVGVILHKGLRSIPSERNIAGQLWKALAPSKRLPARISATARTNARRRKRSARASVGRGTLPTRAPSSRCSRRWAGW